MFQITQTPNGALTLAGTLDIYSANELRAKLIQVLDSAEALSIDLSGVEGCDVTAVQLFCAARKSAINAGKPFQIVASSLAFDQARSALGVSVETFTAIRHQ